MIWMRRRIKVYKETKNRGGNSGITAGTHGRASGTRADSGAQTDAGAGAVHRGSGAAFRRCARSGDAGRRNRYAFTGGADLRWKKWWSAFTGFEEQLKGSGSVMSTFLTDIEQLFRMTLTAEGIEGVILNPWNRTLMLDKHLLRIILGE